VTARVSDGSPLEAGAALPSRITPMPRLVYLVPVVLAGCAVEAAPPAGTSSSAIINGTTDTGDPAVVHISTVAGGEGSACSGTLISPRVVLTAAHCVDESPSGLDGPITQQSVYFGTSRFADPGAIETIEVIARDHLNWNFSGNDIALLLLEHDAVTEPVAFNRTPLGGGHVGMPLRLVGWGNTDGDGGGSGVKRQVTATLQGFPTSLVLQYGTSSANTCQGDSGGPGFMSLGNGEVVASITSFGTGNCLGASGGTRVAQYVSYIDNFIAQNDIPQPPTSRFASPADGASVKSGFPVQVEATDNTRVDRVELWINGVLQSSGTIPPYFFSTPALPDGPAMLEARAYDNRGDVTTSRITVTVDSSCNTNNDCLGALICESKVCVDPIPPEGGLGDACETDADCTGGLCGISSDGNLCTEPCDVEAGDCPSGFECVDTGSTGVCWPEPGGGCSVSGQSRSPLVILLLLCLALRRRRRRG